MTKKTIKINKVMQEINKGKVKMQPKAYFVMGSMLLGVGAVGLMVLSTILMAGVFFQLRLSGAVDYFGPKGLGLGRFAKVLPLKMLLLAGGGLLVGSMLIRKRGSGYKVSLGWLLLGGLITSLSLGWILDRSGANERLRRMRPLRGVYEVEIQREDRPSEVMMSPGMGGPRKGVRQQLRSLDGCRLCRQIERN